MFVKQFNRKACQVFSKALRNSLSCLKQVVQGIALLLFVLLVSAGTLHSNAVFKENQVKAVFLYNLTKFVSWPQQATSTVSEKDYFSITIVGSDPFEKHLETAVKNESVKGNRIVIRKYSHFKDIAWHNTDLLFVSEEFVTSMPTISKMATSNGIFTVGDSKDFCELGGMVNLLTIDNRIQLEINISEIKQANFQVSAKLLRLAKIIETSSVQTSR